MRAPAGLADFSRINEGQAAMPSQESYRDALARVIDEVVAPGAAAVDVCGEFPRSQVAALGAAGLLGLTVPAEYGGGGAGLREAADVVRELGSVCASTAMIVTMHYAAVAALTAAGHKETLSAAAAGADLALRAGGGAAFRKESVVERLFRDSRAARVMAPSTDHLHDFVGRALLGLPLLGEV